MMIVGTAAECLGSLFQAGNRWSLTIASARLGTEAGPGTTPSQDRE